MTKREILPSGDTPARNDDAVSPALIAGVLIAELLCSCVALLAVSGTELAVWVASVHGTLLGLSWVSAAVLLALRKANPPKGGRG